MLGRKDTLTPTPAQIQEHLRQVSGRDIPARLWFLDPQFTPPEGIARIRDRQEALAAKSPKVEP